MVKTSFIELENKEPTLISLVRWFYKYEMFYGI